MTPWLVDHRPVSSEQVHLFCLPFAGGSAIAYYPWLHAFPDWVAVRPLELPGRGRRMKETPYRLLEPLAQQLTDVVANAAPTRFALFGHSMGGLLAFEVARRLPRRGVRPAHVFLSATAAPGTRSRREPIHASTDGELSERLRALGGTDESVLAHPELMELFRDVIRADFSVLETHRHVDGDPLDVPLTVFGGQDDPVVPPMALLDWRRHTTAGSDLRMFPGGHFYLREHQAGVVAAIVGALQRSVDGGGRRPVRSVPGESP